LVSEAGVAPGKFHRLLRQRAGGACVALRACRAATGWSVVRPALRRDLKVARTA